MASRRLLPSPTVKSRGNGLKSCTPVQSTTGSPNLQSASPDLAPGLQGTRRSAPVPPVIVTVPVRGTFLFSPDWRVISGPLTCHSDGFIHPKLPVPSNPSQVFAVTQCRRLKIRRTVKTKARRPMRTMVRPPKPPAQPVTVNRPYRPSRAFRLPAPTPDWPNVNSRPLRPPLRPPQPPPLLPLARLALLLWRGLAVCRRRPSSWRKSRP